MQIWVDADACPGVVKDIIIRAAKRTATPTTFVANKQLSLPAIDCISFVLVDGSADAADRYIEQQAVSGDLVVTQDIPLASALVASGVAAVNPHGQEFNADNITERLSMRNFMQDMRDTGVITGGPKPFSDKEKRAFANTFDRLVNRLLK